MKTWNSCLRKTHKEQLLRQSFQVLLFFCTITGVSAQTEDTTAFAFRTQPYLQNMTGNGVTIFWLTNAICTSWLEYGETQALSKTALNSRDGLIDANVDVQRVRLEKLTPGKSYFYRAASKRIKTYEAYKVIYGDTIYSPIYSFTVPSPTIGKFSFLVFNDIHDRPQLLDTLSIIEKDYDFAFFNGDIVTDIYSEQQITKFLSVSSNSFASSKPFFYTRGNHETRGPASRTLNKYLETPSGKFYYTAVVGQAFFIVLDTGEDKPDTNQYYFGLAAFDRYRNEQARWLKNVVNSKEYRNAKFRIVCSHIPISLKKGDGWHGMTECSKKFAPILNSAKVDLHLCGHTHEARLIRLGQGPDRYVIVDGGTSSARGKATYIKVDIAGSELRAALKKKDGSILDVVTINK
ncbi:MAG: metallophosphoesterase [bacterium]